MNSMTPTEEEVEVAFGLVKFLLYWLIYNLRVSFLDEVIYLALADIKVCFRFPIAMVFGSNTPASSWEPFCRAIEGLTKNMQTDQTWYKNTNTILTC